MTTKATAQKGQLEPQPWKAAVEPLGKALNLNCSIVLKKIVINESCSG